MTRITSDHRRTFRSSTVFTRRWHASAPTRGGTLAAVSRSYQVEAVVLRSLRYGEADRILHVYSAQRGRLGLIAKGVRRTRSRFGGRLEPFSQVSLELHEGRGDLQTVTGVDVLASHHGVREHPRLGQVASAGGETLLRLFAEGDPAPRAFEAFSRFLEALVERPVELGDPALDAALLSLQLKLHWVAGFAPRLTACAVCGRSEPLERFSAAAGGGICASCPGGQALPARAFDAMRELLAASIAQAPRLELSDAAAVARAIADLNAEHGGFRLRSLAVSGAR